MSQQNDEVFDIDALARPVGRIRVRGKVHEVLPANAKCVVLVQQIAESVRNGTGIMRHIEIGREIVAEAVPTLSEEDRTSLNLEQITAISSMTTRQVDQVRAMIKEAEGNVSAPEAVGDATVEPLATETEKAAASP